MRIHFIKNVHFTKLIKVNGKSVKEFNFRKIRNGEDELFSVDVSDDRGNRIMFQMHKDNGAWHITDGLLPAWITENETRLHELIEEELKNLMD